MNNDPFIFLPQHLYDVPISIFMAKTATDQINALYNVADDPATPKGRATRLASLAGRMMAKLNK
jgi:hypothetical protein